MDTIAITENSVRVTPAVAAALAPYTDTGLVHLNAWGREKAAQLPALKQCYRGVEATHDWVAFFDNDEYLMLLERCAPSAQPVAASSALSEGVWSESMCHRLQ